MIRARVAVVVVASAAVGGIAGCSSGEVTADRTSSAVGTPSASASSDPSPTPSPTFSPLPTALPGQLASATFTGTGVHHVVSAVARADRRYEAAVFCIPEGPGEARLKYEVHAETGAFISGGEVPCLDTEHRDTALVSTSGAVTITFEGPFDGIRSAFAAVVPEWPAITG